MNSWLQRLNNTPWSKLAGVLFFFVVIALIAGGFERTVEWLAHEKSVPVSAVYVSGDSEFITAEEVVEEALAGLSRNFFQLKVEDVQQQLVALDWVDSASVQKRWPDKLLVHITEQQPAAIWNGDMLINQRGELFIADQSRIERHLPSFFGPAGSEGDVLKEYSALSQLLTLNDLVIDEVVLSERYAWQLRLTNDIRLHLGQEDRVQRLHRFLTVLPSVEQSSDKEIDYVDLRYDTGMAVGWKQHIENENA